MIVLQAIGLAETADRADLNSEACQVALGSAHAMWASRRRIRFVRDGLPGTAPSFSTVMFARGPRSVDAMKRLTPFGTFATLGETP